MRCMDAQEDRGRQLADSCTCCPRRQDICEKLTWDPLAPVTVIMDRQFLGKGLTWPPGRHTCTKFLFVLKLIFPTYLYQEPETPRIYVM